MKKLFYSIALSLTLFSATAQPPGQGYPCSLLPYPLECYTTAWFDTIDIQTQLNQFHIDSVDTTNVWQFGMSPKIVFDSVVGFVTDTVNPYPNHTKSILEYRMPVVQAHNAMLMFEHKVESDTLQDGGYVQVSCDNGQSWAYLGGFEIGATSCGYMYAYYNYPYYNEMPTTIQDTIYAFTGNSDWMWSAVQLWIPVMFQNDESHKAEGGLIDSLYFRFVFESDSIDSGKGGWMIRKIVNVYSDVCFCGIEENSLEKHLFYPNPAKDHITLNFDQSVDIQKVILYDIANKQTELKLTDNVILTDNIPNGFYHIHFVTDKETYHSRLLIMH